MPRGIRETSEGSTHLLSDIDEVSVELEGSQIGTVTERQKEGTPAVWLEILALVKWSQQKVGGIERLVDLDC
eukprot:5925524-Pleurochrysis_carterae.AAC.3